MAEYTCTATIMGSVSGSDRQITYTLAQDPATAPADEVVEALMAYLHDTGDLPNSYAYELNTAFRNTDKRVVMAIGHLRFTGDTEPFLTMIGY